MFPDNIRQNIDILVVINVRKNNFGFHSNRKTQGQKHWLNNLYFKYQICQMKLRHLNTFLQFRLLFHEPHCISYIWCAMYDTDTDYEWLLIWQWLWLWTLWRCMKASKITISDTWLLSFSEMGAFQKGRIHGKTVADGWAGAENLEKQLCDRPTDRPTDRSTDIAVHRVA